MYFEDEVRANCILQNVSYYRLSGYWYPLLKDNSVSLEHYQSIEYFPQLAEHLMLF